MKNEDGGADKRIEINENNIAWTSDVNYKFANINPDGNSKVSDYRDVQWIDMKDQHFIVWMRTAGLPNFRKLWGKIN